ncbi:hypothetical protein ACRCUN_07720 [Mycobacterium sp. LTG2003]
MTAGILQVEMDRLASLAPTLEELAREAADLRSCPAGFGSLAAAIGGGEPAVIVACSIATNLVDSALAAALKERLSETGEIMRNVAAQFRDADYLSPEQAMAFYTSATGDWDVPGVPR